MRWDERGGVEWLEAELPGGRAVFSTRSAGSIEQSPSMLTEALGISEERLVSANQVHGAALGFHDEPTAAKPEVDGHVLRAPGPIGVIYSADCLPVAVAGPGGIAILHCGWRGLAAGILANGVEAVEATHAAIGPGIGPCCYRVGEEVLDAFAGLGRGVAAEGMLNLPTVTRKLLERAGVAEIESEEICTRCEPELFFSHRREGERAGRQAGLAWLDGAG